MSNLETIDELAKCIGLYARGEDAQAGRAVLDLARAIHAARAKTTDTSKHRPVADMRKQVAMRLFTYWKEQCDHPRAKPTAERARCIVARLKDGYTEADIRAGIDGAAVAAHVNDDTGQRYDDITLICRNGSKLEGFIARAGSSVSDVDAAVDEVPVEVEIRNLRRAMAKARREDDDTRYEVLNKRLAALIANRSPK